MASMSRTNGRSSPILTLNYGVRYDQYSAFNAENQISPRANLVWKPIDATTFHLGYSRYFSPPPYENVATHRHRPVRQHHGGGRSHRHHAQGGTRRLLRCRRRRRRSTDRFTLGLDSYFKADQQPLDEGQFGAPIILTPFNYPERAAIWRANSPPTTTPDDFNAYLNASYERAAGKNITSSQFEFDPDDLAYIANHYIPLDHQQIISLSGGASYQLGRHHLLHRLHLMARACERTAPRPMATRAALCHRQSGRQP